LPTTSSSAFILILHLILFTFTAPPLKKHTTTLCPGLHQSVSHTMLTNIGHIICPTSPSEIHTIPGFQQTGSDRPLVPTLIWHLHNICSAASTKITHPDYDKHSLTHIQTQLDTPLWYTRPLIMNLTLSTIVMLMCLWRAHPHLSYPTHGNDAPHSHSFLDL
jgi:hypothetical protein